MLIPKLKLLLVCLIPLAITAQSTYRNIDGSGNNSANPDWGMAGTMLERYTSNGYEDSMSMPAGTNRPNPREISNELFDQSINMPNPYNLSDFVWNFGQFLDHDITMVPDNPAEFLPIMVPSGDPVFDPLGTGTVMIPMFRSISDSSTGNNVSNPRMQINAITSWIDASAVYGSEVNHASWLRTFTDGKLKTSSGNLLPYNTISGEYTDPIDPTAPAMANAGTDSILFVGGDFRCNEQPGLTALHTLFVREHNRICDLIRSTHPNISDEAIYQRARKIVAAEIQKITFEDWLPNMGVELPSYQGYDLTINPNIMNVFSVSAYRLGHTIIGEQIVRLDANWDTIIEGNLSLRNAYFNPSLISDEGGISPLFRGMLVQRQQNVDVRMVDDLRNFMFGDPGAGGLDLASINIMRGRERGLVDYNQVRVDMGLNPVVDFSDITSNTDLQNKLQTLYGTFDKIDPWVGMLAEDHKAGAIFGTCIHGILQHQFEELRNGDWYYYENDPAMNAVELDFVRNTTLADIIEYNTDISVPVDDVFKVWSPTVGIASFDESNDIYIYPNPSTDYVSVKIPENNQQEFLVQIYDMIGRNVYEANIRNQSEFSLSTKNMSQGIYRIAFMSNQEIVYSGKFIKK